MILSRANVDLVVVFNVFDKECETRCPRMV